MNEQSTLDAQSPAVRTHLELVQGVIERVATNSRSCKVWCVTLTAAAASRPRTPAPPASTPRRRPRPLAAPQALGPEDGDATIKVSVHLRTMKRGFLTTWSGYVIRQGQEVLRIESGSHHMIRLPSGSESTLLVQHMAMNSHVSGESGSASMLSARILPRSRGPRPLPPHRGHLRDTVLFAGFAGAAVGPRRPSQHQP